MPDAYLKFTITHVLSTKQFISL